MLRLLYSLHEFFSGFERRNEMLRYFYGYILFDVTADLSCPLLQDEAAKTTYVYGLTFNQRRFYFFKKCLECYENIHFRDPCLFGDAAYDVCFSHVNISY